jgi:tetratricopeptide (TPR) repeat protein
MLSNVPEPNSIQESNREVFRERNIDILRKLVAFVTLSQGLTIGFAASPSSRETDLLVDFLIHDRDCADIDFIILDFPDPSLHFLLEAIAPKLESLTNYSKPRVVVIRGLEHSINVLGEYPPVLVDLNFTRDAYRRRVPYPILFVLPDYAITRIARFAPDFWAWKSVEFQLQSIQHQEIIPVVKLVPDIPLKQKDLPVSQERFDLLERLLGEYIEPSITRADLLMQRSEAHISYAHYLEAKIDALAALKIYQSIDRLMDRANAYSLLGEIDDLLGLYQEEERYVQAALEIRMSQLGNNHPDVARSLNDLAASYKNQGRYDEAEPLYLRALEIRTSQLGNNHPDVARSLNNLGVLYQSQGRYGEAESLHLRSLDITERNLGKDHPDLSNNLNNLAELYRNQKLYYKAESLYLRSLDIKERLFGKEHPDIFPVLNNLALLYQSQGRYSEAESLQLHSLDIMKSKLGKDHPNIGIILSNLACLRLEQGNYSEAKSLWQEALKIQKSKLGKEHPSTQEILKALASLETLLG